MNDTVILNRNFIDSLFCPYISNGWHLFYGDQTQQCTDIIKNTSINKLFITTTLNHARNIKEFAISYDIKNVHITVCRNKDLFFASATIDYIFIPQSTQIFNIGTKHECDIHISELARCAKPEALIYIKRTKSKKTRNIDSAIKRRFTFQNRVFFYKNFTTPSVTTFLRRKKTLTFNVQNIFQTIKNHDTGRIYSLSDTHHQTMIESMLRKISSSFDIINPTVVKIISGSGACIIVDFEKYIVRIPRNKEAQKRCETNYRALETVEHFNDNNLFPKPIGIQNVNNKIYYIESKLTGISLDKKNINENIIKDTCEQAYRFLMNTTSLKTVDFISTITAIISKESNKLRKHIPSNDLIIYDEITKKMIDILSKESFDFVIQHGDFKTSNFIVKKAIKTELCGIIDWDRSLYPGLPVVDLLTLL